MTEENNANSPKFQYRVRHPSYGEIHVEAASRYWAVIEAAKDWGLRWTTVAKECVVTELGMAPVKKRKEKAKHGKADKKKSRHL